MSRFGDARFLLAVASVAQLPADRGHEVAFAGRSNAGKSSAINAILARRALARTGKTPGLTRLLNFFDLGAERRIVDLPGYGYARVADRERAVWAPLLEALRQRQSLRGLFLVVDARRGIGESDLALIEWADPRARPIHVLLAKADKLTRREAAAALAQARERLRHCASVQLFSAPNGEGLAGAQQVLEEWLGMSSPTQKKNPGGLRRGHRGRLTRHRSLEPGLYPLREGSGECWRHSKS
ncbi:MAG TPA: ribosome biogenesis GTP-binding protein YihA/YsxC [Steroidobacteraceae bacterium]|nr:ribosome biogenesis GTP-binding protein YihA/YsxC [Steroidobacteraceae bacterium]